MAKPQRRDRGDLSPFDRFRQAVEAAAPKFAEVLGDRVSPQRFVRVALTAVADQPELLSCEHKSLMLALMDCAQLGLEPGGVRQQAHILKFGSEAVMVPGYRGLIHLMRRSGFVRDAYAQVVHEADGFDFQYGTDPYISHTPELDDDPGEVRAYYAVAYPAHGGAPLFEVMRRDDVEEIKRRALQRIPKGKRASTPWVTDEREMGRKTAVKRLWKYAPDDPELAAAVQLDHSLERGEPKRLSDVDLDLGGGQRRTLRADEGSRVADMAGALSAGDDAGGEPAEPEPTAGDEWETDPDLPDGYGWRMNDGGYYHVRGPGGEVLNPDTGKRREAAVELAWEDKDENDAAAAEQAQEDATKGDEEPNSNVLEQFPELPPDAETAQIQAAVYELQELVGAPDEWVTLAARYYFHTVRAKHGAVADGSIQSDELSRQDWRDFFDAWSAELETYVKRGETPMVDAARNGEGADED